MSTTRSSTLCCQGRPASRSRGSRRFCGRWSRDLRIERLNQVWCTDITYVWLASGFVYLTGSRYGWLKHPPNLTMTQHVTLSRLAHRKLTTVRAYHLRLSFQEVWTQPAEEAEAFLRQWFFWATHSRLQPMREAAYTMKRQWDGMLRWGTSHINTGVLEGINSLVQAAKARARGYRTTRNLITMVYLIAGKLKFALPT